jgi:uncharacterized OB-fold protein
MVERNCLNCGREIPAGKRFCGSCGRPAPAIAESASPEPEARSCVECGAAYLPGKRFCKQCGHPIGAAEPATAKERSGIAQGESAAEEAVTEDGSRRIDTVIVVPPPPDPPVLLCTQCGAAYAPGKRFCKQCGQVLGTAQPTAATNFSLVEQGESAAPESTVRIMESDHPSAPSEIPSEPSSKAEPEAGPNENFTCASQETQNVSLDEDDFRPQSKFSGDEQEPPSLPQFQDDFAAHDPDIASSGRYELDDSDAGLFRSLQNSTVRRPRTLLVILGAVCAVALLGAVWVVATYYHARHRPAQTVTHPTSPVAVAKPSTVQPSQPAPRAAPEIPTAPAKSAPPRQGAGGHEVPAHPQALKPDTADSYPAPTRSQGGNCTLDSSMLSRMLDQADRNRGQGNYSDAARQYRSVLNCDPNNSRAHSGLELTLVDIQHQ